MREGTTSRMMTADRPYGEFYDFYSVSPEYFGYYLVIRLALEKKAKSEKWKEKHSLKIYSIATNHVFT
jgi:hypothetical protein